MNARWIVLLVVVVVVAVLAALNATKPDATVDVITPRAGNLKAYVEEQAVTELPQDYLIAMPIAERLEPIVLREGDTVTVGQVVAELDQEDLLDRVDQARQRIAVLETEIEKTRDNRLENHMLVDAEATVKAFDETVKAAEAKLEASLAVLEFAESEVKRLTSISEDADAAAARELRAAETEYRKAKAEYQSDALDLAALKTLAAVSYIGPQFIRDFIDRKGFDLDTTQKELAQAKSDLEIEKRNLKRTKITSPIDGVVLERHQTRRQYLAAGTPLLTVGRFEDMEVIAELLSQRATRISPGDRVEVFGEAIEDGPVEGEVLRVYPAGFKKISSLGVEQQRVNVAVRLKNRPERLGIGFRVYVRIYYDEVKDALILPRTALFRDRDGNWQAIAVENGVTVFKTVELGLMNDVDAQVLSGIDVDATIVARPSSKIDEGMRVAVRE